MTHKKLAMLTSSALCVSLVFMGDAKAQSRAYTWTGFYAGVNAGYSWGNAKTTASVDPFSISTPFSFDFPGGSSVIGLKPNGGVAGGQMGYNWQVAPLWVAGVETDFQWTGQKDSARGIFEGKTTGSACTTPICNYTNTTDITAKLSWFGTVRGRLGKEWNGLLFYGTAGLAYGEVSVSGVNTFFVTDNGGSSLTRATPFSYSKTKAGWVIGAGIEGALGPNWSWRTEYLHIDLGSIGGTTVIDTPVVLTLNTTKFTDDIVRVAFNYRFGP